MSFKSRLDLDVEKVFLNTSEFADYHVINGLNVPAVIDTATLEEAANFDAQGIYHSIIRIHVHGDALGQTPRSGDAVTVNGWDYRVIDVSIEQGVTVITAGAYDT